MQADWLELGMAERGCDASGPVVSSSMENVGMRQTQDAVPWLVVLVGPSDASAVVLAGFLQEGWPWEALDVTAGSWRRRAPSPGENPISCAINLIGHWMSMLPHPEWERAGSSGRRKCCCQNS